MWKSVLRVSVVLGCLGLVALILVGPVFISARGAAAGAAAHLHMKDIATASLAYAIDNSDHLPPAANWRDAIEAYVQMLEERRDAKQKPPQFGTAMNAVVCGTNLESHGESVILAFSSTDKTRNAIGGPESVMVDARFHAPLFVTPSGTIVKDQSDVLWSDSVRDFQ